MNISTTKHYKLSVAGSLSRWVSSETLCNVQKRIIAAEKLGKTSGWCCPCSVPKYCG